MRGLMFRGLMFRGLMFILFFPAGVGLTWRLGTTPELAAQVLLLGTLLLSVEQARAAVADLEAIAQVTAAVDDPRLPFFRGLTWIVIGLELAGFYGAVVALGWGVLLVLIAQILFNALATVMLVPQASEKILPWGWRERLPVLIADSVAVGLAISWQWGIAQLGCAIALLLIVLAYLVLKYTSKVGQPA